MDALQDIYERRKRISTYWHNKAVDLHAAAGVLWKAIDSSQQQGTGISHAVACWSVYQMICGMALELLFKAIIVEKGREPKPIHRLDTLAQDAAVPFDSNEVALLQVLSEAIIWDGRYPVPKDMKH
jgi:hypothetical protein